MNIPGSNESGTKTYLFDTHVHTAEVSPCGTVKAEKMVKLYRESGYSGMITKIKIENMDMLKQILTKKSLQVISV